MGRFGKWMKEKDPVALNELNALDRAQGKSNKAFGAVSDTAFSTSGGLKNILMGTLQQIQARNPKADRTKIIRAMKAALDELEADQATSVSTNPA